MPQLFKNLSRALLTSGITSVATTINIEPAKADLFPVANTGASPVPAVTDWFKMVLQDATGAYEIVYVRTRAPASGVLSDVIRGQEGTTAAAWGAGTVAGVRITALDIEQTIASVIPIVRGGTGATTAPAARTALGSTTVGDAIFTAVNEAAARAALGTDVYKTVPRNTTALTIGEMFVTTTGFTLNTGLVAGNVYNIFNAGAIPFTLTQGSGLTLRLAGTTGTGNRTIGAWAMASIWIDSGTQYVISGPGVS